jgi:hypothetical protein
MGQRNSGEKNDTLNAAIASNVLCHPSEARIRMDEDRPRMPDAASQDTGPVRRSRGQDMAESHTGMDRDRVCEISC